MPLSHYGKLLVAEGDEGNRAYAVVLVDSDGNPTSSASSISSSAPSQFLKAYLENGGSNDMAVNGSSTPVTFSYTVPAGKQFYAQRVMIYLEGSSNFSSDSFGNQAALTNGVAVSAGGVELDRWRDGVDLTTTMFDTEGRANFSRETRSISGRWTLSKETGSPLSIGAGDTFSITINDNLSGLTFFRAKIGGLLVDVE